MIAKKLGNMEWVPKKLDECDNPMHDHNGTHEWSANYDNLTLTIRLRPAIPNSHLDQNIIDSPPGSSSGNYRTKILYDGYIEYQDSIILTSEDYEDADGISEWFQEWAPKLAGTMHMREDVMGSAVDEMNKRIGPGSPFI